jgi:spore coat polysaccharide biosynthesis protein SpsF
MNLVIIQARLGSSRLPGKVLMDIGGKPLLGHLLDRLAVSQRADKLVVATSTGTVDDPLEAFCTERGVACFRGNEQDVLDRFYHCALLYAKPGDRILRVMADSPLHHGEVLDFVIEQFDAFGGDFFSNSNQPPEVLEDGADVEMFTFEALEIAWNEANLASQREHVAPYIKQCGKFKCGFKKYNPEWVYKLSVDTQNDLDMVREIFKQLSPNVHFGSKAVTDLLKKHPEILEINKESRINEGYELSLKNDSKVK